VTFFVLIFICVNGAQGCTYSTGHTLVTKFEGSYPAYALCKKAADDIEERYSDPDIYGKCFEVGAPAKPEGTP
jgi:hypothetical protein